GEGLPVAHVVKNSIAFRNNMDGFSDNFNPGALILDNNLAIDNVRFNYLFRKSPYAAAGKQGSFINNQSYRFYVNSPYSDVINADYLEGNRFIVDGKTRDQQGREISAQTLDRLKAEVQTQESGRLSQAQLEQLQHHLMSSH
ncbi:hypothetical protein RMT89_41115, partial [Streptomyces sp. P17]|nr:hypothetical protein [Streptomyces sp. P17]